MDKEIWRDVKGYEGLYAVSNLGRVKSLGNDKSRREKILRPCNNMRGYLQINLWKGGERKLHYIHRLVLSTFSPCENSHELQVNHIDENKLNNSIENLEWCDSSYNINHGTRNKRSAEKNTNGKLSIPIVQLSREGKYIRSYKSSHDAAREGGYHQGSIIACCRGRQKTHGDYKWMYLSEYLDKNCGIID